MIKLDKAVVVEGKYDKIRLSNIIDAEIIETGGFRIFKEPQKCRLIKRIAETKGIIILTDSDSAGLLIRNHIKNIAPAGDITNVYLPRIEGKEKRKAKGGKEGILGVEGTPDDVIISALQRFAVRNQNTDAQITKTDFYNLGICGGANSKQIRAEICKILDLPMLSATALLQTVNLLYTRQEFLKEAEKWQEAKIKN